MGPLTRPQEAMARAGHGLLEDEGPSYGEVLGLPSGQACGEIALKPVGIHGEA
ncbi:hypothetical protein [Thermus sp.]|uniref:hypothetical protein n=1 Tax=Thermus sp. TaxID=275 RepID=UPI00307E42C0